MKLSATIGRSGDKLKLIYLGDDAGKAVDAMEKEQAKAKPAFDEVVVLRNPAHFRRRKIVAVAAPEPKAKA